MRKQLTTTLSALAVIATASGCSSMAGDNTQSVASGSAASTVELQAAKRRVSELENQLAERERRLTAAQAELERGQDSQQRSFTQASAGGALFPPNPKPGECYARVLIPAEYATTTDRVLTQPASERIEIIPAQYETAQERVIVKEASTRLEVVPATYKTIEERVLVKPASQKIVEVPAEYRTVTEQVLDKPAHTAWKKGAASIQTSNVLSQKTTDTGEVMCLVEVPATYKTVEKRELVRPARTETVEIPAEYKTVTKRVLATPATTREVTIPAEYDTVQVTRLVTPAREKRIAIPAAYETIARTEKVSDEQLEWRQVMCDVNLTQPNIRALQRALKDKGYYTAGVDGVFGPKTLSAAQSYAASNNLPAGSNYIPMDVIRELGLDL